MVMLTMFRAVLGCAFLVGCAGRFIGADDSGANDMDATDTSAVPIDAQPDVAIDVPDFSECPEGGPTSCADIGKCPGKASCCNGKYCNGNCYPWDAGGAAVDVGDGVCACAGMAAGCVWPTVCCDNQWCVAPSSCP